MNILGNEFSPNRPTFGVSPLAQSLSALLGAGFGGAGVSPLGGVGAPGQGSFLQMALIQAWMQMLQQLAGGWMGALGSPGAGFGPQRKRKERRTRATAAFFLTG